LPLAEGVVQRIVDQLLAEPEARSRVAVNHERGLEAAVLLIAVHVGQYR
jgi:hypothetical protein